MNICIYSSSKENIDKKYILDAEFICEKLADKGHTLVYGAASTGIMGASARGFYKGGGEIIGIAPSFMEKFEPFYENCTQLIITKDMSERKEKLEKISDVFLIFPGGIGTFDEFFQILTLRYLEQSDKEIVLYNAYGYYNKLIEFLDSCFSNEFISDHVIHLFEVVHTKEELLKLFE